MITSIGSKIKELRQERGICQRDICCEIISQTVLSRIENGKMLPSIPQLEYIADCLGVPVSSFFETGESPCNLSSASQKNISYLRKLYEQNKYITILDLYESNEIQDLGNIDINYYVGMSYYNEQLYNVSLKVLRKFLTDYKKLDSIQKNYWVESYATALNKLHLIMTKTVLRQAKLQWLRQDAIQ